MNLSGTTVFPTGYNDKTSARYPIQPIWTPTYATNTGTKFHYVVLSIVL